MALLLDAQMTVASAPGTGAVTLGAATNGGQTWATGGAVDGASYTYRIDGAVGWEVGTGAYAASGPTLTRTTILASSNGGAAVNFGADAVVSQVAGPGDLPLPFRNRLINGNLAINQRGAATTSTTYAAGAYVMDRFKAGSSGCTLSFATAANGVDVVVTITAGTLMQVIEGGVYLPEGGAYVLSWSGTAQARVYQGSASGSYAASPVRVAGLTAGMNATIEWGTGTLSLAQFEPGASATVFERRDDELRRCRRYCRLLGNEFVGWSISAISVVGLISFSGERMAAAPSLQTISGRSAAFRYANPVGGNSGGEGDASIASPSLGITTTRDDCVWIQINGASAFSYVTMLTARATQPPFILATAEI